jgi:hypothetical protein
LAWNLTKGAVAIALPGSQGSCFIRPMPKRNKSRLEVLERPPCS